MREGVVSLVPGDHIASYKSLWFFWSHSWHFFTVPPYSQYSGGRVQTIVHHVSCGWWGGLYGGEGDGDVDGDEHTTTIQHSQTLWLSRCSFGVGHSNSK